MADKIIINDLRVEAVIGVYPEERLHRQPLILQVEIDIDLGKAARTDRLEDTVNYAEIEERIVRLAESSEFFLIERLAGAAGALVVGYPGVLRTRVRVEKPAASRRGRSIAVEVETLPEKP